MIGPALESFEDCKDPSLPRQQNKLIGCATGEKQTLAENLILISS
jgi:hypothetical protein